MQVLNFTRPCKPGKSRNRPGASLIRNSKPKPCEWGPKGAARAGQSACAVARSLNVSQKLIYRWQDQQTNQAGRENTSRADELDQLKAQLKRVEMERDTLKNRTAEAALIIVGQPT